MHLEDIAREVGALKEWEEVYFGTRPLSWRFAPRSARPVRRSSLALEERFLGGGHFRTIIPPRE
jgi:hypothetical protein